MVGSRPYAASSALDRDDGVLKRLDMGESELASDMEAFFPELPYRDNSIFAQRKTSKAADRISRVYLRGFSMSDFKKKKRRLANARYVIHA